MKSGNLFETRNGNLYLYHNQSPYYLNLTTNNSSIIPAKYNDNLTHKLNKDFDIMRIYEDYTCQKIVWERKEVITLTDADKFILQNRPADYDYIARDNDGSLYIYKKTPHCTDGHWFENDYHEIFSHLCADLTLENSPVYIPDLLKS